MNGARGEVAIEIDGASRRLCLTLGALAEIETALACRNMTELEARLRQMSATDLIIVLAALLRGGGECALAATITQQNVSAGDAARAVAQAFRLGLGA
jgi:Phage tail tube protein, GTA-gp10